MSKNKSAERCIKDDRELHEWIDWAKEKQREMGVTEPPYDPQRSRQIAAEVKARLAASALPTHADALKDFIRLYCEATGVAELTARARSVNGKIAVEITERR